MHNIIQFKATLLETNPSIWRRVRVPGSVSFFDLHHIFQISMGWKNSHLFEFVYDKYRFGYLDEEFEELDDNLIDADTVNLANTLSTVGEKFVYTYDFGENWEHEIVVEDFLLKEKGAAYPFCVEGAMKCPPEDCGSIHGFYNMLKALKNKSHPEYKEYIEWLGEPYNPEDFNVDNVNAELPRYREWMKHWRK